MKRHVAIVQSKDELPLFLRWLRLHRASSVLCLYSEDNVQDELEGTRDEFRVTSSLDELVGISGSNADIVLVFARDIIRPMEFRPGGYRYVFGTIGVVLERLRAVGVRTAEIVCGSFDASISLENGLHKYSGAHSGDRCFVIGNGPSLAETDMNLLRSEITFGSNRCYLGFKKWNYPFTYWGCTDRLQIEEYAEEYESNLPADVVKFLPTEYAGFSEHKNQCFINQSYEVLESPKFSQESDVVHMGNSVTYSLMQIAAIMGVRQIILLGVDHNYPVVMGAAGHSDGQGIRSVVKGMGKRLLGGTRIWRVAGAAWHAAKNGGPTDKSRKDAKTWTVGNARGKTHFDEKYTTGKRFIAPRLVEIERALESAKVWGEKNNVEILNATPGSALNVFPKVSLDSLF